MSVSFGYQNILKSRGLKIITGISVIGLISKKDFVMYMFTENSKLKLRNLCPMVKSLEECMYTLS